MAAPAIPARDRWIKNTILLESPFKPGPLCTDTMLPPPCFPPTAAFTRIAKPKPFSRRGAPLLKEADLRWRPLYG